MKWRLRIRRRKEKRGNRWGKECTPILRHISTCLTRPKSHLHYQRSPSTPHHSANLNQPSSLIYFPPISSTILPSSNHLLITLSLPPSPLCHLQFINMPILYCQSHRRQLCHCPSPTSTNRRQVSRPPHPSGRIHAICRRLSRQLCLSCRHFLLHRRHHITRHQLLSSRRRRRRLCRRR